MSLRRWLLLLVIGLAACSQPPSNPGKVPQNQPTVVAPTEYAEGDQAVTLSNVATLKYLGRLDQPGTLSTLFSSALSPDDSRLVALNNDQLLSWNLLTGALLFQTSRSGATRVFYSPDKTEVYTVDDNGLVAVYDANKGAAKTTFQGQANYSGVAAYSPDDGWLALGGTDGTVKVWDTYARQALVTINAQSAAVTALAFSPDGSQLATAGGDGAARVWNWRNRSLSAETKLDTPVSIRALAFSPDARWLAIGTDQDARLWSMTTTSQIDSLGVGRGGANQILTFAPDSRYLLAGNQTVGLSLWTPVDHTLAARLPDTQGESLAASFSPDGKLLLTSVLDGGVALWNLTQITGQTVNEAALKVGTTQILNVEWTDDSRLLLFFDASGPVYVWGIGQ